MTNLNFTSKLNKADDLNNTTPASNNDTYFNWVSGLSRGGWNSIAHLGKSLGWECCSLPMDTLWMSPRSMPQHVNKMLKEYFKGIPKEEQSFIPGIQTLPLPPKEGGGWEEAHVTCTGNTTIEWRLDGGVLTWRVTKSVQEWTPDFGSKPRRVLWVAESNSRESWDVDLLDPESSPSEDWVFLQICAATGIEGTTLTLSVEDPTISYWEKRLGVIS